MIPGSANSLLLAADEAAAGYQISRSLRFNSSDSVFLSRNFASAGNRKTWTWSGWVKRASLDTGTNQVLFSGGTGTSDTTFTQIDFAGTNTLRVTGYSTDFIISAAVFRDVSAWYHITVAFDATQGTNANKLKIYINGSEIAYGTDNRASISNQDYGINQAAAHALGRNSQNSARYFDGYLADVHLVDGQALDPTSFTEVDATTGQLIPKAYTGSYGTNGFHLPFSDNSTAAALGTDTSGNSNTWTVNNISVTAGAGNDSLVDTPTSYGVDAGNGGEVRGNYCTWNPLDNGGLTLSNGNLEADRASSGYLSARATIGVSSGKWYWECTCDTSNSGNIVAFGIATQQASLSTYVGADAFGWSYFGDGGSKYNNGSGTSYGATFTTNDVIGVALDLDAGTLVFYKNGVSQGTAYSSLPSSTYFPAITLWGTAGGTLNAGQRPFAYTAPSGYKALCTTNLPAPVVAQPSTVMDVVKYDGNSSTQSITGLGFSPDFVWIKSRSNAENHVLSDIIRGTNKFLYSDLTAAENTSYSNVFNSFDSTGFTLGYDAGFGGVNVSGRTYVAWTWDAGSTTASNTDGSITSSVRANASAGFSIVTYTGNGTTGATIGHGLGVAPAMVIVKNRSRAMNWWVYGSAVDSNNNYGLFLNTTDARQNQGGYGHNNTYPTSSVFYGGIGGSTTLSYSNYSGDDYVAYCFAPVDGYSSFGSYTGNGSADGPFVYTGHRSRWVMIKRTDTTGGWVLIDTARSTYNLVVTYLYADLSNAEATFDLLDITSNGFKLRNTFSYWNASGGTYIYAAFAESPFQYARAR